MALGRICIGCSLTEMERAGEAMHPIALHSWTLGMPPLLPLIETARRAGYDAIEINWQDIERCRETGVMWQELKSRLDGTGLVVAVVGVEPGWLFAEGLDADRRLDRLRRTADDAAALGCGTLMSALGRNDGPIGLAERNIRSASRLIVEMKARFALEYNFGHPTLSSLERVRDLVRSGGSSDIGLVIDAYHLHRGGRPGRGFDCIGGSEILHVQFSDVPAVPSDDGGVPIDRLAPGTGQVDWQGFLGLLFQKGYQGSLSYEAPNPVHWSRDPDETASEGIRAIRRLLALTRPVRSPGRNPSNG
jgi:sugar phosphate isomerase/epimerase